MSYANPKPINPAVKFIDWKGDEGKFVYYKKSDIEGEQGENVEIPLPVKLIIIDELSTITGFNDANQTGVFSNEVQNITKEILNVQLFGKNGKNFRNIGAIGLYKDIKADIKSLGGRYAKSVYALLIQEKEIELVNLKVKGSFLNAWIEKKVNADEQGILINDKTEKKKGKTTYFEPVIEGFTIKDPVKAKAIAITHYKLLHEFFNARKTYFEEQQAANETDLNDKVHETYENAVNSNPENDDDLPF